VILCLDIIEAKQSGANGIVVGILTEEGIPHICYLYLRFINVLSTFNFTRILFRLYSNFIHVLFTLYSWFIHVHLYFIHTYSSHIVFTGDVDVARMKTLITLAYPLPITFHRAFGITN
jgi:hypothetical protein